MKATNEHYTCVMDIAGESCVCYLEVKGDGSV